MALDKEIDIIMKTEQYINEISYFGVNNLDRIDGVFKKKIQENMSDLNKLGFIKIAEFFEKLLENKDVKLYVYLKFILKEIQNNILKTISS